MGNDEIVRLEGGALDPAGAEVCLLDDGHFLLEGLLDAAARTVRRLPERTTSPRRFRLHATTARTLQPELCR